jgi:hypothetical protein
MEFLPAKENGNTGQAFKGVCFEDHLEAMGPTESEKKWDASNAPKTSVRGKKNRSFQSSHRA